jgi:hypothetical protein
MNDSLLPADYFHATSPPLLGGWMKGKYCTQ